MERLKWYIPNPLGRPYLAPLHSVHSFVLAVSLHPFPCEVGRKHPFPGPGLKCGPASAWRDAGYGVSQRGQRLGDRRLASEQIERLADGGRLLQAREKRGGDVVAWDPPVAAQVLTGIDGAGAGIIGQSAGAHDRVVEVALGE